MHPLAGIKKFGSLGFLADTQFFKEIRYSKIENPNTTQTNDIHHTTYCYYTVVVRKCERIVVVLRYFNIKWALRGAESQNALASYLLSNLFAAPWNENFFLILVVQFKLCCTYYPSQQRPFIVDKMSASLNRRSSFLSKLSDGKSDIKRRLSRKSSFLESKPIKTLAKLTRR